MALVLDPLRTTVRAFTSTEGLFARLAHDLELSLNDVSGDADEGPPRTARVRIGVAGIRVVGVVKKGRTDEKALADWERAQIVGRIRDDVFAGCADILVEAILDDGQARFDIAFSGGSSFVRAAVQLDRTESDLTAHGECFLSLNALGIPPQKGPLGAFVVADSVRVVFSATFAKS